MDKPKYRFVIRYRSGIEVPVAADALTVKWDTSAGQAIEVSWDNMRPRPLAMGIANIESVWQVN
jgi:hypothetical protein